MSRCFQRALVGLARFVGGSELTFAFLQMALSGRYRYASILESLFGAFNYESASFFSCFKTVRVSRSVANSEGLSDRLGFLTNLIHVRIHDKHGASLRVPSCKRNGPLVLNFAGGNA